MAQQTIQHRMAGNVVILALKGRLTIGETSVTLRETVRQLLADGHRKILIDLGDVGYVDSSGLGELVSAFASAKRQDAVLKLVNVTQGVLGLLQMTKLVTVFETFEDEGEAVRSFEPKLIASGSS